MYAIRSYYVCFFGMHVLTPTVMDILAHKIEMAAEYQGLTLSSALADLAKREQYLALELADWRYNVGEKYGLLNAQLALARITSYNVCYTKLLRTLVIAPNGIVSLAFVAGANIAGQDPGQKFLGIRAPDAILE